MKDKLKSNFESLYGTPLTDDFVQESWRNLSGFVETLNEISVLTKKLGR